GARERRGAPWGGGDEGHRVPPAGRGRVAGEERVELGVGGAPQPGQVGGVEALVRARRIAVSAFTLRHDEADITGCARSPGLLPHRLACVPSLYRRRPMRARLDTAPGSAACEGWVVAYRPGVDLVGSGHSLDPQPHGRLRSRGSWLCRHNGRGAELNRRPLRPELSAQACKTAG